MTNAAFIEHRIIMTPGPVEADPRVLKAMGSPIINPFDARFLSLMDEVMVMGRKILKTDNHYTYLINGTARAGIEALLSATIEPGDKVYIPIFGRFGHLMAEIAKRAKGDVHTTEKPLGEIYAFNELKKEIDIFNPKVVAIVHGESSTGMMQPLKELGAYCKKLGILLIVDAVATLAGAPLETDAWHIDGVVSGSQKCLAAPAGMALLSYNKRIEDIVKQREKIEQGLDKDSDNPRMIPSNYLDLSQLQRYWDKERLNHHTEATSMMYALHEAMRLTLEEGLDARIKRHQVNMKALVEGLKAMGLTIYGDSSHLLSTIVCVNVPESLNPHLIRNELVRHFSVEIAPGFGPLKDKLWRIGALGYSSRKQNVLILLAALEAMLSKHGAKINQGRAVAKALSIYDDSSTERGHPQD